MPRKPVTIQSVVLAALKRCRRLLMTASVDLESGDRIDALDAIAMARRELDAAENRIRSTLPRIAA